MFLYDVPIFKCKVYSRGRDVGKDTHLLVYFSMSATFRAGLRLKLHSGTQVSPGVAGVQLLGLLPTPPVSALMVS